MTTEHEECPVIHTTIFQKIWLSDQGIGGSERAVDRQSRGLVNLDIPVTIFTCGEYYRGKPRPQNFTYQNMDLSSQGIRIHEIPTVGEIVDILSSIAPAQLGILQIVWGFEHYPDSLNKCLDIPVPKILNTMEMHQFDQLTQEFSDNYSKSRHLDNLRQKIDCVVAISSPLAEEAKSMGFRDVRTIYIPIPTDTFTPVNDSQKHFLRKELNLPEDKKICFYAGRIVAEKGVDIIMDNWELISNRPGLGWHLLIAGGVKPSDPLYQRFTDFCSRSDVSYVGVVSKESLMSRFMQTSDVFLYPTRHTEGLGLSVAEAMACGLPVITTDYAAQRTGMRDLITPGVGIIFDHITNPIAIAKILDEIDHLNIPAMGSKARTRIFNLGMDEKSVAEKWKSLYCELLLR